ncbi:hypothetical protein CRYUN_Cryun20dG0025900 [Craigia yunnanensis]
MGTCWSLFHQIPNKDVLWSAMVAACVKNGDYVEAFELFRRMQFFGLKANHVSIVSILPACANLGALRSLETAIRVFDGMLKKDLVSWRIVIRDEFVLRDMIMAVLQSGESKIGSAYHSYIVKSGFLAFVSIATALLQMYAKFGMVGSARNVFDHFGNKDVIAWNAMISAYTQSRLPFNAVDTFTQMLCMNMKPNEFSLVSLLQMCSLMASQEASHELGESIQAFIAKVGYSKNVYLSSALIDFYCRSGRVKEGKVLFNEVPTKDLICWSSLINGHCGLEYEGWNWFYSMKEKYGIIPNLAHYACMVDLLSRQGNILNKP